MSKPDETKPTNENAVPAASAVPSDAKPADPAGGALNRKIEDVAAHALEPGNLERFRRS
jgi:hypothetical protein